MRFLPTLLDQELDELLKKNLVPDDIRKATKNCCSAILILGQNQSVIKRADLTRLTKSGTRNHRVNIAITHLANFELNKTLGMRLFESSDDKYLLVNSKIEYSEYFKHTPQGSNEMVVLFFILIIIFTSAEEKSSDSEIKNGLRALEYTDDELKKIIETLVKKNYLTQSVQQDEKLYSWGPRAVAETEPKNFFDTFLELAGEGKEDDWPEQKRRIENLKKIHYRV